MPDTQAWMKIFPPPRLEFCTGWAQEIPVCCQFHGHPQFEIVYHYRGDGVTTIQDCHGKKSIAYAEGAVVIYPPNLMHSQRNPARAIDVCILFSMPEPWPAILRHCCSLPPPLSDYERDELFNLAQPHPSLPLEERCLYSYRLMALLVHLLDTSSRHTVSAIQQPETRYAEEARNYMRLNYAQIQDIGQVAQAVGIGYDHLRHIFKAAYGISLVRSLNKFRLERARDLLMHSRLPLKTIAPMCGFQTERYFVTSFKKDFHLTPGVFRDTHRTNISFQK